MNGFASVSGDGLTTTTGGGNESPTTVTTFAQLSSAVAGSTARVIIVSGTISTTDGGGSALKIGSNKTIRGADKNATIYGGIELSGVKNVIVQDLNFHGIYPNSGPDDAIALRNSHHVWLDHLNIWDAGDGNLDITNQSSYVTVSWCRFWYTLASHPHRLCCLIGSGGGDHPEDWGRLKVTFHHNWFSTLVDQRMPRLMYGQGHFYNNYYTASGNGYCIGVGSYGSALIENNYFKGVSDPHTFMYDVWCYIVARGNTYVSTQGAKDTGLGGSRDVVGQEGFDVQPFNTPPYPYTLDSAANIPTIVQNGVRPYPQATPPPVAPASLNATAGNASVSLTWAAVSGATSYNVKRAITTGGPYTTVASPTGTSHTDTGLTNGTSYYYVVSAVNSGGESANSGQASATPSASIPGTPTPIQAETGTLGGGAAVGNSSSNAPWNGTGYVDFPSNGGTLDFSNINGGGGGTATLTIRFAVGGSNSRTGSVITNGIAQPVTFPSTSATAWNVWTTISVNLPLQAGATNTIRIASIGQDLANIDELTVTPPAVLPVVTIAATDNAGGEFGADQAIGFTLTRTIDSSAAMTVPLTASGSATAGSDYSGLTSSVTIPAGQASIALPLTVLPDALAEGPESVTISLGASANFTASSPASASASIADRPSQAYFFSTIADPTRRGPTDDADGDSAATILEYFMGSHPGDAGNRGVLTILSVGEGTFKVRYPRAENRPDVSGSLRWSADLKNWFGSGQSDGTRAVTFVENVISESAADPETVEATATITGPGASPSILVRLQVE